MKRTKPTFKQRQFAKAYIRNNGNGVKSALEVYDADYANAKAIAVDNLKKPIVVDEINKILSHGGLNENSYIAQQLVKAIDSGIGVKATNKDALQGINMLMKVTNAYPSNKSSSVKLTLRGNLSADNVSQVITKLQALNLKSKELIEDIS